jgi:small conductance mechanosensitive channel
MWPNIAILAQNDAASTGVFAIYVLPAIKVILILVVAYLLAGWAGSAVTRACQKSRLEQTLARFFGKLTKWAIIILALLSVLSVFGVQTTSFAAVIGASALAIGLAFQGTLANFAAGAMLLIFRPFKVGDVVESNGELGIVDEIDIFNTSMDTFDNRRVILPNGSVFGSTIINYSHHPKRRADVNVGTAYDADLDRVRDVLQRAAESVEGRVEDPEPAVVLNELGDSSVQWQVRVWAPTPDWLTVRQATVRAVKQHLDEAGVPIPFPQRDVHLDQPRSDTGRAD